MALRGLPDSYIAEYEAPSTYPRASFACTSTAARPVLTPSAATAATNPEYMLPEALVNPAAPGGAANPSFFAYLRQLRSQSYAPSSATPLPAKGPPGAVAWPPSDPTSAGATLTVPPPVVPGITSYQQASPARPGQLLAPSSNPAFTTNPFMPGSRETACPRLLPPVPTAGGWLSRGRFSSAAFTAEDMPGFGSLRRGIVLCVMLLLVNSLFACIGRADFNFVLYLLGYHLWCVESDTKSLTGLKRLIRGARQYAIFLCIAAVVDTTWLFIAYSTWVCEKGDPELCFPEPENLKVRWAYGIHSWALGLSTFNLLLKLLVIFLSFAWVQQQLTCVTVSRSMKNLGRAKMGYASVLADVCSRVPRDGIVNYVKFHCLTDQGIKNFSAKEAEEMQSKDLDYAIRDLFNAIERKDYPSWSFYIQVMQPREAETYKWNILDITKVWPHKDYPLIPVGKLVLNKNPHNYFQDVEQAAFSPAFMLPGIEASEDRMLQGRLFSYSDTHRHRLGPNYLQIPVNKAWNATLGDYHVRDGFMCVDGNKGPAVNYEPNTLLKGAKENKDYAISGSAIVSGSIFRHPQRHPNDDFEQPRNLYRHVMKEEDRKALITNIVSHLKHAQRKIQERQVALFYKVDSDYGERVARGLGLPVDLFRESKM